MTNMWMDSSVDTIIYDAINLPHLCVNETFKLFELKAKDFS